MPRHPTVASFVVTATLAALTGDPAAAQCNPIQLTSLPGANAELGRSIDVDGDHLVVGSPATDTVRFFKWSNGSWLPEGPPVTMGVGLGFGASVSVRHGVALVGMPGETVNGLAGAGRVHIFLHGTNAWIPIWTLDSPSPAAGAAFGSAVDHDGVWYLVGAPGWASDRGRAHVFFMTSSGIGQPIQVLGDPGTAAGARYGAAVAIDQVAAVVGAPGLDVNGVVGAGGVFPYRIGTGSSWAALPPSTFAFAGAGAGFGRAVDLSGNAIAIGSAGSGFAFLRFDGQVYQPDTIELGTAGELGWAVAVDGTLAAVTSPADAGSLSTANVGTFRTFEDDGNAFVPASGSGVHPLSAPTNRLGDCAALSGPRLALGAPLDATLGPNAGAAYVYDLTRTSWLHALHATDGLAGTGGLPTLAIEGTFCPDDPFWIELDAATPSAPTFWIAGLSHQPTPLLGGTLGPTPDLFLPGLATDAAGKTLLAASMPPVVPSVVDVFLQVWVQTPSGPQGYVATDTVRLVTP